MSRDAGQARNFSLLSVSSTSTDHTGNDDLARIGRQPLRPLPSSREPSPNPHRRLPSLELRGIRSAQNMGSSSRNASPVAHSRLPSLSLGPNFMSNSPTMSPSVGTARTAITPGHQSQYEQSPAGTPGYGPGTANPFDMRNEDLVPPPPIGGSFGDPQSPGGSRGSSRTRGRQDSAGMDSGPGSRTASPAREWLRPPTPTEGGKLSKKKGWGLGKSHNKNDSTSNLRQDPSRLAFIVGPQGKMPYEVSYLVKAQPVPELWSEQGNLLVHLFGRSAGPSFKVDASIIGSSSSLLSILHSEGGVSRNGSRSEHSLSGDLQSMSINTLEENEQSYFPDMSSNLHLYIPLGFSPNTSGEVPAETLENLVALRNLFAFLVGQVLVGTPKLPTLFSIFNNIAGLLRHYEFSNMDGATLGEAATASFLGYVEDLNLGDVRASREKTIEAIILGERMKCWPLYNEGYVHGVGKWDDLVQMNSPQFSYISGITRKRMEKSSMDLFIRLKAMRLRLDDFDFPSLFAGVAASSASNKVVDFRGWKASFLAMRKHTILVYKHRYGAWPPKARSKKNDFEESGLNRILMHELYRDFCDLYDMIVDRKSMTTRSIDVTAHDESLSTEPAIDYLRKLMSEFDRSMPPVRPPVPFDIPMLPDITHTRRDLGSLPVKKQAKARSKKLKDDEINLTLMQSYNRDAMKMTPFLESYMAFERSSAHGKTIDEMVEMRIGQWIFLYVILQSLPLVVVDAPGIRWVHGVEYFLCEAPKGSPPWTKEDAPAKTFYRVAGGNGLVSMPQDVVEFSVEGIFHRSHCWQAAAAWSGNQEFTATPTQPVPFAAPAQEEYEELPPPPSLGGGGNLSAPGSPQSKARRNSLMLGLEPLPMPPPIMGDYPGGPRKGSTPDPNRSFENILGPLTPGAKKKRWDSLGA